MKKQKINIYIPIIASFCIAFGIYIGANLIHQKNNLVNVANTDYSKTEKLKDILNYIDNEYVDDVSQLGLVDETIQHLLQKLDPHSYYITPEEFKRMNEPLEGKFHGIGVQFSIQNDTVMVITPVNGGPSEKLGILAGDRIVVVEKDTIAGVGVSNSKVMKLLKGEKGTQVNISILRNKNEWINFSVERDEIPLNSVEVAYMATPNIGYISISKFSKQTYSEFLEVVNKLQQIGMKNLILDLRGNGGGIMESATRIVDEFLTEGKMIVYTEGRSRPKREVISSKNNALLNTKLVIIIDEGSASASEIVAGAIQDWDRGTIIGRRSFGKGLVQEQSDWPDGSAVRLTTARYYTPTGRCIQRPYNKSKSDYFTNSGEVIPDKIPDSLKFSTPKGKIVYGGGGITPDVLIPYDTTYNSLALNAVYYKGLVYKFSFKYTDVNRDKLNFNSADDFIAEFAVDDIIYSDFLQFVNTNGLSIASSELTRSEPFIKNRIKAQIGRNLFDNDAYYPIVNELDVFFLNAIEILNTMPAQAG